MSIDVYTAKDLQDLGIFAVRGLCDDDAVHLVRQCRPRHADVVMRGVSDGSNPNYANTATTAFLVDDMSMNYYGTTPDLHLYDIERIEVLNGPQGTTFGAGAMAGALRFITNKPDPKEFSAGVDADAGKIDGGTHNGTIEGFINIPLIPDWTALRISAFSDYHGGFIKQHQHHTQLGQRGDLEQLRVGRKELQRRESHRGANRTRPGDRRWLEGERDRQIPEADYAWCVGRKYHHRRRRRPERRAGQRAGARLRPRQRGSFRPGEQTVLRENFGLPSGR